MLKEGRDGAIKPRAIIKTEQKENEESESKKKQALEG